MASLWRAIKKCSQINYDIRAFPDDEFSRTVGPVIVSANPTLIDVTEQAVEWNETAPRWQPEHLDATPCKECLWFESREPERFGILMWRHPAAELRKGLLARGLSSEKVEKQLPDQARHSLQMILCTQYSDGLICCNGMAHLCIDSLGRPVTDSLRVTPSAPELKDETGYVVDRAAFVCEVMTIINTRGTRIEPGFDPKPCQVVKPKRTPCSVWHTIHIPRFAQPPLGNAEVSTEMLERREHWVRGHRRDYREGGGMFGRVKALVWVPEFKRGNAELGTVKQTYVVHPRSR